jgi:hypothetical protein
MPIASTKMTMAAKPTRTCRARIGSLRSSDTNCHGRQVQTGAYFSVAPRTRRSRPPAQNTTPIQGMPYKKPMTPMANTPRDVASKLCLFEYIGMPPYQDRTRLPPRAWAHTCRSSRSVARRTLAREPLRSLASCPGGRATVPRRFRAPSCRTRVGRQIPKGGPGGTDPEKESMRLRA